MVGALPTAPAHKAGAEASAFAGMEMDMMDVVESCLGDVLIITCIAMYAYLGIILTGIVARRVTR